ncbi:hypothetical protein JL101_021770 [Skermanella rosea]|uniref:hypothetical protein n=1 Tax=Skermanella rosea TaxID=1817965 RepID=UPI0019338D9F|nr:hypothetical protein [Skermanella rosea]UEM02589.1 hypothetical protein JL101_021770 [Skermanella rosea]
MRGFTALLRYPVHVKPHGSAIEQGLAPGTGALGAVAMPNIELGNIAGTLAAGSAGKCLTKKYLLAGI